LRLFYKSFSTVRADQLVWNLDPHRLRILCYHGLCEDRLADEPWTPHFFVSQSVFEAHLRYLARNARVLPLHDAVVRLKNGNLEPRSVCLTFDDGYANNLELAYPLLKKYGMHATIFLSSAYMESGEYFPFLQLKLIRNAGFDRNSLPDYKTLPAAEVVAQAAPLWDEVRSQITDDQRRTLRPLTVDEVRMADPRHLEFGAHTHSHCILSNETMERRQHEIRTSIQKVSEWTEAPVRLFSYPNGQRGDFSV
jgi:peptidoglycan/xylan/chitin deacetylase (PgdA/CDA1 family)